MTGALSIFTINTRFLILLVPVLMWCAIYFVWRIVPGNLALGRARLPINLSVLVLLLGLLANKPWEFARTPEGGPHANAIETSNVLHAAGARTAREILSTNLYHQDVASPTRDHFIMLHQVETPPTVDELRRASLQSGYRFLIFTASDGMNYHPQYQDLLSPERGPVAIRPSGLGQKISLSLIGWSRMCRRRRYLSGKTGRRRFVSGLRCDRERRPARRGRPTCGRLSVLAGHPAIDPVAQSICAPA